MVPDNKTTLEELRNLALQLRGNGEAQVTAGVANGELLSRLDRLQCELDIVAIAIRLRAAHRPY